MPLIAKNNFPEFFKTGVQPPNAFAVLLIPVNTPVKKSLICGKINLKFSKNSPTFVAISSRLALIHFAVDCISGVIIGINCLPIVLNTLRADFFSVSKLSQNSALDLASSLLNVMPSSSDCLIKSRIASLPPCSRGIMSEPDLPKMAIAKSDL